MKSNMLESLVGYANAMGLSNDKSTRQATVAAAIHLDVNGRYLNVVPYSGEKSDQGKVSKGKVMEAPGHPKANMRASNTEPFFLVDNLQNVLGIVQKEGGNLEKAQVKKEAFVGQIKVAYDKTQYVPLKAILRFYVSPYFEAACKKAESMLNSNENICFRVGDEEVVNNPILLNYWRQAIAVDPLGICMVCGCKAEISQKHPKITGFPGNPTGAALFSNNNSAFQSKPHNEHGLMNAPVCNSCVQLFSRALELLLKEQKIDINPASPYAKVVVYWSNSGVGCEEFRALCDESIMQEVFESLIDVVYNGGTHQNCTINQCDLEDFNIAIFGCQRGRVSLRRYYCTTVGELYRHILAFVERTSVTNQEDEVFRPSLRNMANSVYPPRLTAYDYARAYTEECLLNAALFDEPFSDDLLEAILTRVRAEPKTRLTLSRLATLQYCISNHEIRQNKERSLMSLERTYADMPFLLGRLVAIADQAQRNVHGPKQLKVSDRYLDSIVTTPGLDIGEFMKEVTFYLRKSYRYIQNEADEVFTLMGARVFCENGLVAHDTYQQARCVLGYQLQKIEFAIAYEKK